MIDGKSFKDSAKDRLKEGIKPLSVREKAFNSLTAEQERRKSRRQSKKSKKKSKKRNNDIFD